MRLRGKRIHGPALGGFLAASSLGLTALFMGTPAASSPSPAKPASTLHLASAPGGDRALTVSELPPALTGSGPVGNATQLAILDDMEKFRNGDEKACALQATENANFPKQSTYVEPTTAQLESMMDLVEDLDATWIIDDTNPPYRLPGDEKTIGPEAFRRALYLKVITPLQELAAAKPAFEQRVDSNLYLLRTACGKVLFRTIQPSPRGVLSLKAQYSDVDEKVWARPFGRLWQTLDRKQLMIPLSNGAYPQNTGYWSDDDHIFIMEPLEVYPASYSSVQIADLVVRKQAEADAWRVYDGTQFALFTMELLPMGSVWKTVLAKGVYQYEAWDAAEDSVQIATDSALDLLPVIAQYKKARTASKFLWAATASGVVARAGWQTYQSKTKRPPLVDVIRLITVAMLGSQLSKLSKAELVDDLATGMREASGAVNGAASSGVKGSKKAAWRQEYAKSVTGIPYARTMADVAASMHALVGPILTRRIAALDGWSARAAQVAADPLSDGARFIDDLGARLAAEGKTLVVNPSATKGVSEIRRVFDEADQLARTHPGVPIDDIRRELIQDELKHASNAVPNHYDEVAQTLTVTPLRYQGDISAFSAAEQKLMSEEMDLLNRRIIQEEATHAMGDALPGVGYPTKATNAGSDRRYVPLTVRGFNFHAWLSQTPAKKIRELLSNEAWLELQSAAAARNVTSKQMLHLWFPEADIYFRLAERGVPMNSFYTTGISAVHPYSGYPVRELAERWAKDIAPGLGL